MQKTAYIILFTALLTTTLLVSCKDSVNQPSNEVLTKDKGTSILIESTLEQKEWEAFKRKTDSIMNSNDTRIAELKLKVENRKKTTDTLYLKKIKVLEEQNLALKTNLNDYEKKTTKDWNAFKIKFNEDLKKFDSAIEQFNSEFVK
tara:strand:- start:511 stop:948 length:438 start_codon:yes stop_codon:yes gene_type:complete